MAILNFPTSPTIGQTYNANGKAWTWDGVSWNNTTSGYTGSQGPIGYTGSVGFVGSQGVIGYTGSVGFVGSASTVAGPIGYTGSQGLIGYTGSQGVLGPSVNTDLDMNNYKIIEIKTASFNSEPSITTTAGSVAIDWTAAQNQKQNSPSGAIDYNAGGWTPPPGPCHMQLKIPMGSTLYTITWPTSVLWLMSWGGGTINKTSIVNLWFDGTNYYATALDQV